MSALSYLTKRMRMSMLGPAAPLNQPLMEALRDVRQMRAALREIDRMANSLDRGCIRKLAKDALANREPYKGAWAKNG